MLQTIVTFLFALVSCGQVVSLLFAYMTGIYQYIIIFIILGWVLSVLAITIVMIYIKMFKQAYRLFLIPSIVVIAGTIMRFMHVMLFY